MKKKQNRLLIMSFFCSFILLFCLKVQAMENEGKIYVLESNKMVYLEADIESKVVGECKAGDIVYVLSEADSWINIFYDGLSAYIVSDMVQEQNLDEVIAYDELTPEIKSVVEKMEEIENKSNETIKWMVMGLAIAVVLGITLVNQVCNRNKEQENEGDEKCD